MMKVYGAEFLGEDGVPEIPPDLPNSQKRGLLPPAFQRVMDAMEDKYKKWILEAW